ncbi:MAG: FeoB-associated Cys-rich membrane protein [Myxococcota bacterium]
MDWQAIVVALVVVAAVVYLARRAYVGYKRPSCGDSCASCPSKGEGPNDPAKLVQIRLPDKKKDGTRPE